MRSLRLAAFLLAALAGPACASESTCAIPYTTPAALASHTVEFNNFQTVVLLPLEDLWDLYVGPVETASITTTVAPTPVATNELVPPPPLHYPSFLSEAQVPFVPLNKSWSFGKNWSFWGVATASYQVEGAVKDEGRGPSIWDVLTHRVKGYTVANETGDIADNQYYLYKQDIARIAALGVDSYSFSISWSRIMPFGRGQINEAGLQHYDDLIDFCLKMNVKPIVTLYHWDLPLFLQNLYGGWLSTEIIGDYLAYAKLVFNRYGDRVKYWYTFNEPVYFCNNYPLPAHYFAANPIPPQQQPYVCTHNVLLAHAEAYHYAKTFLHDSNIGFKIFGGYKIPLTVSKADAVAVQRAWDFNEGWFAEPLFLTGDYPASVKAFVSEFLPPFTTAQKAAIVGSADHFAYDAYTSLYYSAPDSGVDACVADPKHPLYPGCYNTSYTSAPEDGSWNIGPAADSAGAFWLHRATDWVPALMRYVQETWKPAGGIAVTEFGFAEPFEDHRTGPPRVADMREDVGRCAYYKGYLEGILMAIAEGTNVIGCLAWTMVDNMEWKVGLAARFGMQYVDFETQERRYKASFFWYVEMFRNYLPGGVHSTRITAESDGAQETFIVQQF